MPTLIAALTTFQGDLLVAIVAAVMGALLGGSGTYAMMKRSGLETYRRDQRSVALREVIPAIRANSHNFAPSVDEQLLDIDVDTTRALSQQLETLSHTLSITEHRAAKRIVRRATQLGELPAHDIDLRRAGVRALNGSIYRAELALAGRFHGRVYRVASYLRTRWLVWRSQTMT